MEKLTKLESQLLELLAGVTFYASHGKFCQKVWNHNPNLKCTCSQGKAQIKANIVLNKYGMGFAQYEIDKTWPKDEE